MGFNCNWERKPGEIINVSVKIANIGVHKDYGQVGANIMPKFICQTDYVVCDISTQEIISRGSYAYELDVNDSTNIMTSAYNNLKKLPQFINPVDN